MGKHPGILEKLKSKKQPPVPTRRIAVSDEEETKGAPVDTPVVDDAEYLEETSSESADQSDAGSHRRGKEAKRSKPVAGSLNMSRRHRSSKMSFASGLKKAKDTVFGKRTRERAALDFAMNNKRISKRQRRRRMLLAYIGTGIVVAAVLLVVVFVPGGKAASSADADAKDNNGLKIAAAGDVSTRSEASAAPTMQQSPSASALDEPAVSVDGLMETQGEESGLPVEGLEPTVEPTIEPTVEPTEELTPIPTTDPDPTPPPITLDSCAEDFIVEADKYYNDYKYSPNHYEYSEDDVYMLAQVITSEARGESRTGKIAVGNVIMNRVLNRYKFENTIKGVISASGQFAYNPSVKPTGPAITAARYVLQFEVWVIAQDVYYFRSGSAAVSGANWGSHQYYTKIGGHCFYSHNYGGRHRGGEPPPKLFERVYKYAQYGCKPEMRVYRIQYMLNKLGYDVKADKYFGKDTVDALKEFQEKYGLEADGIAGPSTVSKLIDAYGIQNYYRQFIVKE